MPDIFIRSGSPETERRIRLSPQMQVDLPQPEQIEVIDEEGAYEYRHPAQAVNRVKRSAARNVFHMPHDSSNRTPLPEHQQQQQTGKQDIRAAFGGFGHDLCPRALKPLTCHDAVLN